MALKNTSKLRMAYDKFVHERPDLHLVPFAVWSRAYLQALEEAAAICDLKKDTFERLADAATGKDRSPYDALISAATARECARDIRTLIMEAV